MLSCPTKRLSPLVREFLPAALDVAGAAGATLLSPFLLWKLLTVPRWRCGFAERFALKLPSQPLRDVVWIHAVSAGELLTAEPLLRGLRQALPSCPLFLTVTTEAGHVLARERLPDIPHTFWPVDFSWSVRRLLGSLRPRLVVLLELELWPNFLLAAEKFGVPVVVVNGRITERTARRWRRLPPLARFLFNLVDHFAVQNEQYACRLRSLGVIPGKISVCGNLKFDVPRNESAPVLPLRDRLRAQAAAPILVGGCTHPGEEALLVDLAKRLGGLPLVLAPRHLERVEEVERLVRNAGLQPCRLTDGGTGDVLIVDAFGRLDSIYRSADLVVMGGTFVPHGGHNMLEPARWGKAVVFGPSIDNFRDIAVGLLAHDAAVQVPGPPGLEAALAELVRDPQKRKAYGRRALEVWRQGQGSVKRYVAVVKSFL